MMRKPTIYENLKERLGREPTNAELKREVSRILEQAPLERTPRKGRKVAR